MKVNFGQIFRDRPELQIKTFDNNSLQASNIDENNFK